MHDDPEKTTPAGLLKYAQEFYLAARAADHELGIRPGFEIVAPIPVMYLTAHSIELSLKSYLLHHRVSLQELRGRVLGHDLEKCMQRARNIGLDGILELKEPELNGLVVLNKLYCTKQLNYIVTGMKTFPVYGPIQTLSKRLLESVGKHVGFRCECI